MKVELTYLDTYVLQKDMRIRLPKAVLTNLRAIKGETRFSIYLNQDNQEIVLKKEEGESIESLRRI